MEKLQGIKTISEFGRRDELIYIEPNFQHENAVTIRVGRRTYALDMRLVVAQLRVVQEITDKHHGTTEAPSGKTDFGN